MLVSFLSGEFLLHIPCWLYFYVRSFYYTSHTGLIKKKYIYILLLLFCVWVVSLTDPCCLMFLIWGVSLTHPMLFSFLSVESLLNIPCCFIFIWGVSLTHPMLTLFLCFSYTSHADFVFMWGVSLTQPVLASFLSGEFLLHIPCWLHFYVESFSYTSRAGFNFIS